VLKLLAVWVGLMLLSGVWLLARDVSDRAGWEHYTWGDLYLLPLLWLYPLAAVAVVARLAGRAGGERTPRLNPEETR
jgi:hypothetical protein